MNKKIRIILASTSFILALCLIFSIFTLVLLPKENTKEAGFRHVSAHSIVNESPDTIDVLILGTSQAYSSFIPLEIWKNTGITSYVCSTPSQPLYYTVEFLRTSLQTQSPKLVVLETDAFFEKFNEVDVLEHKLGNIFPLINYHSRWKELTSKDFSFNYDYSHRHIGKGFVYDYRSSSVINSDYMIPTDDVKMISDLSIYYFEQIVNLCYEKNIKLILISALSAANWDYSKHNAVEKIAKEYNLEYTDVNLFKDEICLDWGNDWIDEGKHLNYYGAVKITNWLESYLKKFDFLEDKRDLPEYNYWHEDARQIDSKIEQLRSNNS